MASDTVVVAAVLASVLLFFILFFTFIILYIMCCLRVTIGSKSHKLYELVYNDASFPKQSGDLEAQFMVYDNKKPADSGVSNVAVKSIYPVSVTDDGDLLITREPAKTRAISEDTLQYHDALQKFDTSSGLQSGSSSSGKPSNFGKLSKTPTNWLDELETIPRTLMLEDSETLSRTLLLLNLIDESLKSEECIARVADPYLDSFISVGGIVVVVKPFHGNTENEFKYLQPGDLIRVVMFYAKNDNNQGLTASANLDHGNFLTEDGKILLDKTSSFFPHLYCKGVLLNTYLEYNQGKKLLVLKLRDSNDDQTQRVTDLLKAFPLDRVSLETTVLRTISETAKP